ncbi:hypothetical protein AC1031_018422 [Aphanomyces cochlioides]|nr:hypothetical protein AC1031_018422 [Aphanomyces cochlioides]
MFRTSRQSCCSFFRQKCDSTIKPPSEASMKDDGLDALQSEIVKESCIRTRARKELHLAIGYYTLYIMTVYCPITKKWWLVNKRYSHYYKLRSKLQKYLGKCQKLPELDHTVFVRSLKSLLELPFPKKRYIDDDLKIIEERTQRFRALLSRLMHFHAECFYFSQQVKDRGHELPKLFVQVYELLHVFLETSPDIRLELQMLEVRAKIEETQVGEVDDSCAICIEDFDDCQECILQFPCSHAFHRDCVMDWIMEKQTCPICRSKVVSGSIVA